MQELIKTITLEPPNFQASAPLSLRMPAAKRLGGIREAQTINSRENYMFFGHNSEPCGNFWTILRHKLPIIHPDLPIPSNNLNSSVQPEFLNPIFLYKTEKSSRVLTAERNRFL
jgi:hypothetical protein